jgi:hypothetical protein
VFAIEEKDVAGAVPFMASSCPAVVESLPKKYTLPPLDMNGPQQATAVEIPVIVVGSAI